MSVVCVYICIYVCVCVCMLCVLCQEQLFYTAGVDMVFSGHVHAYERSKKVYQQNEDVKGIIHVTIGDGNATCEACNREIHACRCVSNTSCVSY